MFKRHFFFGKKVLGHVPDSGQGKREDRGAAGEVNEGRGNSGLEQAFVHPRPARLCFQKAEGSGVCGRLFLAWVPQVFPAAQAEPSLLEGEDRGEP